LAAVYDAAGSATHGGWRSEESAHVAYRPDEYRGRTYAGITYTLVLHASAVDVPRERVLLAGEVLGYVLRAADERGDAEVARVAFRDGLHAGHDTEK
jgi:hypothetical protein